METKNSKQRKEVVTIPAGYLRILHRILLVH